MYHLPGFFSFYIQFFSLFVFYKIYLYIAGETASAKLFLKNHLARKDRDDSASGPELNGSWCPGYTYLDLAMSLFSQRVIREEVCPGMSDNDVAFFCCHGYNPAASKRILDRILKLMKCYEHPSLWEDPEEIFGTMSCLALFFVYTASASSESRKKIIRQLDLPEGCVERVCSVCVEGIDGPAWSVKPAPQILFLLAHLAQTREDREHVAKLMDEFDRGVLLRSKILFCDEVWACASEKLKEGVRDCIFSPSIESEWLNFVDPRATGVVLEANNRYTVLCQGLGVAWLPFLIFERAPHCAEFLVDSFFKYSEEHKESNNDYAKKCASLSRALVLLSQPLAEASYDRTRAMIIFQKCSRVAEVFKGAVGHVPNSDLVHGSASEVELSHGLGSR